MQALHQKIHSLLRWSERYTKTDMVYLTKGGFWLVLGQVTASLAALLLSIGFANLLSADIYGSYRYVLSIAGILALFTLGGMNTAISRAAAMNHDTSLASGVRAKMLVGILGLFIGCGIGAYYFSKGNSEFGLSFLIVGFFVPLFSSFYAYESFLQGKKLYRTNAKYFSITHVVSAAVMFCVLLLTNDLRLILLAYFTPWTILRYGFYRLTIRKWVVAHTQDPEMIPYGLHLTAMNLLPIIAAQIDKILLFQFIGPIQLAVYSFALALPEQVQSLFRKLAVLAFPKYVEKEMGSIRSSLKEKMWRAFLVALGITILYIILCPFIFKLLFPQYLESIFYSQVFSLSILASLSFIPIVALEAKKKTRSLYAFNVSTSVIQILLTVAGIYFFGVIGAITAKVIGRLFGLSLSLGLLMKR